MSSVDTVTHSTSPAEPMEAFLKVEDKIALGFYIPFAAATVIYTFYILFESKNLRKTPITTVSVIVFFVATGVALGVYNTVWVWIAPVLLLLAHTVYLIRIIYKSLEKMELGDKVLTLSETGKLNEYELKRMEKDFVISLVLQTSVHFYIFLYLTGKIYLHLMVLYNL